MDRTIPQFLSAGLFLPPFKISEEDYNEEEEWKDEPTWDLKSTDT